MFTKVKVFILILVSFYAAGVHCQKKDTTIRWELMDLPLKDLVNIEVETGSKKPTNIRTSPSILTVITESEIEKFGIHNFQELLECIPGFDFSAEWDHIIGLGVRGNNATEGKFLLLYNGFQLNETNFGTFPFFKHLPVENIKQVEVIRGPGSALYGGSAELAVINVITKTPRDVSGGILSGLAEFTPEGLLTLQTQGVYGRKINRDILFNLSFGHIWGKMSNQKFLAPDTTLIDYSSLSGFENSNIQFDFNVKGLKTSVHYDSYYTQNVEDTGKVKFESFMLAAQYRTSFLKYFYNDTYVRFKQLKPWYFISNPEKEFYNSENQRWIFGNETRYVPNKKMEFIVGAEGYRDHAKKGIDTVVFQKNGKRDIAFYNISLFTESVFNSRFGNLNFGGRIENHSHYGWAFVPRVAYTKAWNRFHLKYLFSKAFKAPTLMNIDYNLTIVPEKTTVHELETGFIVSEQLNLVANLFHIQIQNPIVYIAHPVTGNDYYSNFEQTGSKGAEISAKYKPNWGYFSLAYSYYQRNKNTVPSYEIEGKKNVFGAFPQHKWVLNAGISLTKYWNISAAFKYFGYRYTYIHADKKWENLGLTAFEPTLMVNLSVTRYLLKNNRLSINMGINNLLKSDFYYLNAYQSGQNPIPASDRSLNLNLRYRFSNGEAGS